MKYYLQLLPKTCQRLCAENDNGRQRNNNDLREMHRDSRQLAHGPRYFLLQPSFEERAQTARLRQTKNGSLPPVIGQVESSRNRVIEDMLSTHCAHNRSICDHVLPI